MPVLKVHCPECDASIRHTFEEVDEPTDFSLTCPRCENEFSATAEPETTAAQGNKKADKLKKHKDVGDENEDKPRIKANKRQHDEDEDEEDNSPRKKKKKKQKEEARSKTPLILGAVGGVLLLVGGIVAAVLAFGGSKEDTVKKDSDPAPKNLTPPGNPGSLTNSGTSGPNSVSGPGNSSTTPSGNGPGVKPSASSGTTGPTTPTGPMAKPASGTTGPSAVGPGPAPNTSTPSPSTEAAAPPKKDANKLRPGVPPPPIIRLNSTEGAGAGTMISEEKAQPRPPLAPEEDPFVRAKTFQATGALPPLPKLPPVNQRPILALDSGGHSAFIRNVFITPAGDRVITVGDDKQVRIWEVKSGNPLNTIRLPAGIGKEGSLQAAAFSSKGKLAVSGTPIKGAKQGTVPIFIINVETGTILKVLNTANVNSPLIPRLIPQEEVVSLHFSSDGDRIAAGCLSGSVQVFNVNTGNPAGRLDSLNGVVTPIREVRFNPNAKSQELAILYADSTVNIVDLKNTSKSSSLKVKELKPVTLAWSNDARSLAVGGQTGEINIYNTSNGNLERTLPKHEDKAKNITVTVNQIAFLPGDAQLVYGGLGGWVGVIDLGTAKVKLPFTAHTNTLFAVTCSLDGKMIVSSGGNQNETFVWNPANGKIISRLCGEGKGIWGVGWSFDGKSIGWGTKNKADDTEGNCPLEEIFRLDDFGPGGPAFQTRFQQSLITDETFSAKKRRAITDTGEEILLLLVKVGNKDEYAVELPHGDHIYSVCVLPKRGKIVLGGAHAIYIMDPQTQEKRTLLGTTGHTLSIAPSPDGKYFVTGSSDQIIRIWQPELDEPVMSIFVVGRDWIAWTPQGFYACSPHGERLLAWQINNTAYKAPQVYPASRFRASLYQPALIKYLLPAGNLQYAMAMAKKFDNALISANSVADVLPPEANLDPSLLDDLVIDKDSIAIKATAKGSAKQPITAMRLLVDGRPFQGKSGIKRFDVPAENAEATWDVPLAPGPHTFAVIAETPVSKGMTKPATITRKGEVPKPNLYILSMGISEYQGPNKLPPFAADDAKKVARAFQNRSREVFGSIEVRIITDQDATKKGMRAGLDWLASKMTPKDVGIVFYSGHGTRDEEGRFCLCPIDIQPTDSINSCLAGTEFKSRLDEMPGRLVAILNSCHSGEVTEHEQPPPQTDSLVQDLASDDSGVVVMCASLGREYAIGSTLVDAGYFSLAIVEGLEGHADINEDGVITIDELDKYAYARVRQLSEGKQNSTTSIPSGIRPFPLGTVPKSATGK